MVNNEEKINNKINERELRTPEIVERMITRQQARNNELGRELSREESESRTRSGTRYSKVRDIVNDMGNEFIEDIEMAYVGGTNETYNNPEIFEEA